MVPVEDVCLGLVQLLLVPGQAGATIPVAWGFLLTIIIKLLLKQHIAAVSTAFSPATVKATLHQSDRYRVAGIAIHYTSAPSRA